MIASPCPSSARQPASPTERLRLKYPMGTEKALKYPVPQGKEMLFLESNLKSNKQGPSETTKPGWSFCLPPDSRLCFVLGAGLKKRGPGAPLPTTTRSCLAPSLPSPAFPQFGFPHCWCLPITGGHGLSRCQQPNLEKKIRIWEVAASASSEPQPLVLQGTCRSRHHPAATAVFWRGIGHPQGCESGQISSEPRPGAPVACQKHSPEAAHRGFEALAWL